MHGTNAVNLSVPPVLDSYLPLLLALVTSLSAGLGRPSFICRCPSPIIDLWPSYSEEAKRGRRSSTSSSHPIGLKLRILVRKERPTFPKRVMDDKRQGAMPRCHANYVTRSPPTIISSEISASVWHDTRRHLRTIPLRLVSAGM